LTYWVNQLPPWTPCFQWSYVVFTRHRPPPFARQVHPSTNFPPLQRTGHIEPAGLRGRIPTPSTGFLSSSRHQKCESTCRKASQCFPMFRPQRFSRSRRFTPRSTLRAYFIPLPRPGFAFQGFSPLPSQLDSSPSPFLPSCRSLTFSCSRQAACTRFSHFDSRGLFRAAIRSEYKGISFASVRSPLRLYSLGLSFVHLGGAFTSPPLMTSPPVPQVTPASAFNVSMGGRPRKLSPVFIPVRAF
jgi:hypothetical protein